MSWSCPYEIEGYCKRLKKTCKPASVGCVLHKRVKMLREGCENLDLRPMSPFERHEKIFQIWGDLKAGETLKIINDHDPKPLHYQFEAEYKGKYAWEYKQSGPKDWIVEIKKL